MTTPRPGEQKLMALIAGERRGPRRNAIFAAWLVLRAALDHRVGNVVSDRNHRHRLAAIRTRLSSLTLPEPVRSGMYRVLERLALPDPGEVAGSLAELQTILRTAVHRDAADAVQEAVDAGADPAGSATL